MILRAIDSFRSIYLAYKTGCNKPYIRDAPPELFVDTDLAAGIQDTAACCCWGYISPTALTVLQYVINSCPLYLSLVVLARGIISLRGASAMLPLGRACLCPPTRAIIYLQISQGGGVGTSALGNFRARVLRVGYLSSRQVSVVVWNSAVIRPTQYRKYSTGHQQ